jgi:chromosome segregation ATPase
VQSALDDVRACHADSRRFFDDVFGELDALTVELESRQRHVSVAVVERPAASDLSGEGAQRLDSLLDLLAAQQTQWQQWVSDSQRAKAEAEQAQATVAAQVARLAAVAGELAEAQRAAAERGDAATDSAAPGWHDALAALDGQCRQLQQTEHSLAERLNRLGALADELSETRAAGTELRQWQSQAAEELAASARQREDFGRQQEAIVDQVSRMAAVAGELAEARHDLASQCQQMRELHSAPPSQENGDDESRRQLSAMAERHASLEREHALLELELDTVRARAAELSETLAAEKRAFGQQQNAWTEELQRMRRVLEQIAERRDEVEVPPIVAPLAAPGSKRPTAAKEAATQAAMAEDPVLDSVMAQFAMLQKDVARRRSAG